MTHYLHGSTIDAGVHIKSGVQCSMLIPPMDRDREMREDEMRAEREKGRLRYDRKYCGEREMWVRREE